MSESSVPPSPQDGWHSWSVEDTRALIAVPGPADDKYTRGVLGMLTGSTRFPGAAVLGVEAAVRTGVGMVRYLGPDRPTELVLQRRPEIVTVDGRVQAWLVGSGMDADRPDDTAGRLREALADPLPAVIDAGALDLLTLARGPVVITPHFRELARLMSSRSDAVGPEAIAADPGGWAFRAAQELGVTVLLKGARTHIVAPSGDRFVVEFGPAWLSTAGSGDVLGGIIGALLATHESELVDSADPAGLVARLAAAGSALHGLAAARASGGGPIAALDIAEALPATIAELLRG